MVSRTDDVNRDRLSVNTILKRGECFQKIYLDKEQIFVLMKNVPKIPNDTKMVI